MFFFTERRMKTNCTGAIDAVDKHGLSILRNGDTACHRQFLGKVNEYLACEISKRHLIEGNFSHSNQAHSKFVARPVGDLLQVSAVNKGSNERVGGTFGEPRSFCDFREGEARPNVCNHVQDIQGARDTLHRVFADRYFGRRFGCGRGRAHGYISIFSIILSTVCITFVSTIMVAARLVASPHQWCIFTMC